MRLHAGAIVMPYERPRLQATAIRVEQQSFVDFIKEAPAETLLAELNRIRAAQVEEEERERLKARHYEPDVPTPPTTAPLQKRKPVAVDAESVEVEPAADDPAAVRPLPLSVQHRHLIRRW
jgi:hypothetical protein